MPIHDMQCSKCNNIIKDEFYSSSSFKIDEMECPVCHEVGGMSIYYTQGLAIGFNTQRKDLSTLTPGSFKEVLGAIKAGVAKGQVGSTMDKY